MPSHESPWGRQNRCDSLGRSLSGLYGWQACGLAFKATSAQHRPLGLVHFWAGSWDFWRVGCWILSSLLSCLLQASQPAFLQGVPHNRRLTKNCPVMFPGALAGLPRAGMTHECHFTGARGLRIPSLNPAEGWLISDVCTSLRRGTTVGGVTFVPGLGQKHLPPPAGHIQAVSSSPHCPVAVFSTALDAQWGLEQGLALRLPGAPSPSLAVPASTGRLTWQILTSGCLLSVQGVSPTSSFQTCPMNFLIKIRAFSGPFLLHLTAQPAGKIVPSWQTQGQAAVPDLAPSD